MVRESDYYIWLRDLVGNRRGYKKLLKQLDTIPFTVISLKSFFSDIWT